MLLLPNGPTPTICLHQEGPENSVELLRCLQIHRVSAIWNDGQSRGWNRGFQHEAGRKAGKIFIAIEDERRHGQSAKGIGECVKARPVALHAKLCIRRAESRMTFELRPELREPARIALLERQPRRADGVL